MTMDRSSIESRLKDPITQHMRTDFASLRTDLTIGDAIATLRESPPSGRVIYFYAVDEERRLKGVIPTRRLLLSSPNVLVTEIMLDHVISIPDRATVLDACEFFILHRLLAFPVTNPASELVGVVDVELYTTELQDLDQKDTNDDLFQVIGVHLSDARPSNPMAAFRSRFPWLIANICGGILAAFLTGMYEVELKKVVTLALFIPVVLALAESVSIQSVSLATQLLHGKRPTLSSITKKLRSEVMTGILLGLACGTAVSAVALVWQGQVAVALCLLGGIAGGVLCASVIGVALPNLLRYLDRDPQVAAGPIALALTDMVTLLVYFTLARSLV
ncbi:MAG: magnesium transporter [Planctomycetaceae bacterium]|nr:magnesium transporter [Planctomycetaceae bacterium]